MFSYAGSNERIREILRAIADETGGEVYLEVSGGFRGHERARYFYRAGGDLEGFLGIVPAIENIRRLEGEGPASIWLGEEKYYAGCALLKKEGEFTGRGTLIIRNYRDIGTAVGKVLGFAGSLEPVKVYVNPLAGYGRDPDFTMKGGVLDSVNFRRDMELAAMALVLARLFEEEYRVRDAEVLYRGKAGRWRIEVIGGVRGYELSGYRL